MCEGEGGGKGEGKMGEGSRDGGEGEGKMGEGRGGKKGWGGGG